MNKKAFLSLENVMDKAAFAFFSQHREFFDKGIIHIGKFEHYFQIFRNQIIPLFSTKSGSPSSPPSRTQTNRRHITPR